MQRQRVALTDISAWASFLPRSLTLPAAGHTFSLPSARWNLLDTECFLHAAAQFSGCLRLREKLFLFSIKTFPIIQPKQWSLSLASIKNMVGISELAATTSRHTEFHLTSAHLTQQAHAKMSHARATGSEYSFTT